MITCDECSAFIDTDEDPGAFIDVLGVPKVICEACRDRLICEHGFYESRCYICQAMPVYPGGKNADK